MKRLLILSCLILSACSGSGGSNSASGPAIAPACSTSPVLGSWSNGQEVLTFSASCSGTSDYCSSQFTYPNTTNTSGSVLITVLSTAVRGNCLPAGATTCLYVVSGQILGIDCGSGQIAYTKQ